jgi:hypothetical protein
VTDLVQLISIVVSAGLLLVVVELVRRRKLTEEYSFIWIVCALALLGLSVWRNLLDLAARVLGVHYPPAVLLLVLTFSVVMLSLYFSVIVSRQRQQIERLVEELALLDADVRALRRSAGPVPPDRVVPGATRDSEQAGHERRVRR